MTGAFDAGNETPLQPASAGLNTLDRERAASLADEGGASAAAVESQDATIAAEMEGMPVAPPHRKGWLLGAAALGLLAGWGLGRRDRRRS